MTREGCSGGNNSWNWRGTIIKLVLSTFRLRLRKITHLEKQLCHAAYWCLSHKSCRWKRILFIQICTGQQSACTATALPEYIKRTFKMVVLLKCIQITNGQNLMEWQLRNYFSFWSYDTWTSATRRKKTELKAWSLNLVISQSPIMFVLLVEAARLCRGRLLVCTWELLDGVTTEKASFMLGVYVIHSFASFGKTAEMEQDHQKLSVEVHHNSSMIKHEGTSL